MYARFLASVCLLMSSAPAGWAQSAVPSLPQLEVYLRGTATSSAGVLTEMRGELSFLMQRAGFQVMFRDSGGGATGDSENVVVVDLHGSCTVAPDAEPLPANLVLASTAVSDGRVLPFSSVECETLNRFLWPVIAQFRKSEQVTLYSRAIARLLAHELFHVLARTEDHTDAGLSKPRFSAADLIAARFDFEPPALGRVQSSAPEPAGDDAPVFGR